MTYTNPSRIKPAGSVISLPARGRYSSGLRSTVGIEATHNRVSRQFMKWVIAGLVWNVTHGFGQLPRRSPDSIELAKF
jgi:hypothetical protein